MAREAHPSTAGHQQGSQAPAHQLHAAQQPVAPFRHFDTLAGWQGRPQAAARSSRPQISWRLLSGMAHSQIRPTPVPLSQRLA